MVAYQTLICPSCGNLKSECSDASRDWFPQLDRCWASASTEWGLRRVQKKYKTVPEEDGMHPLDGVRVWVSPVDVDPEQTASDFSLSIAPPPPTTPTGEAVLDD